MNADCYVAKHMDIGIVSSELTYFHTNYLCFSSNLARSRFENDAIIAIRVFGVEMIQLNILF